MNHTTEVCPRRLLYGLLITVAVAAVCGRIAGVRNLYDPGLVRAWPLVKPTPTATLSANDRSRWATIRALVDDGTYSIGWRDTAPIMPSVVACLALPIPGKPLCSRLPVTAFVSGPIRAS